MLDIKMIRTDGEKVKERIRKREMNLDSIVDEILDIDKKRRELTGEVESKKAEQNADSKKIPQLKKAGEDTAPLMERMKALSAEIKEGDAKLAELEEKQKDLLLSLPNLPDEDVCAGGKEQNQPIRYFKEQPKFDYEPKNHVELCEGLGMIDYQRGAKIAGAGSWLYRGWGSRLEWALLNFFVNEHIKDGYEFILPTCWDMSAAMWRASSRNLVTRSIGSRILPAPTGNLCCPPPRPRWSTSIATKS